MKPQPRRTGRERKNITQSPLFPRTYHKLTGTFQPCLYWELIGPLNISRCLRDFSLFYFTLITSCSGLPARDPLSLCKSLWIWIFSTPWWLREKININNICQVDPDLRLYGFICERRRSCAGNSGDPAEGPGPAGKRGVRLFSQVTWASATWEVITHPSGQGVLSCKQKNKTNKQNNAQNKTAPPIILFWN